MDGVLLHSRADLVAHEDADFLDCLVNELMVLCRHCWLQVVLKPSEDRRCLFVGDLLGDGRRLAAPEQIRLILQQALCVRALLCEDCGEVSCLPPLEIRARDGALPDALLGAEFRVRVMGTCAACRAA